ncbi:MAG: FAD-dependent oxidoreductase [Candidatus Omnitrophica bacterium]|nr:FAD-dependent oxidoreductase [Candidatus Omnitrophota bacterium]
MSKKIKTKFLILGGGLSGLFIALFLKRQGYEPVILEKSDDVGGLARTYSFQGHSFDVGGHRISFHEHENIQLVQSLIPDLSTLTRRSKIYYSDRFIDYPITLSSFMSFSKKKLLKIVFEMAFSNRFVKPGNFEEWIRRYYGQTIYEIVFEHYSRKVWGQDCKNLSAEWAKRRIGYYSFSNLFHNIKAKENMKQFYYPGRGIGVLAQNLYQELVPQTTVLKNVHVQNIQIEDSSVKGVTCSAPEGSYDIQCEHLMSTIPLKELLKIAPFAADHQLQSYGKDIRYRSLLQVNIVLNREHVSDWHWCYFPDEDLIFSRCYEPKYWHGHMGSGKQSTLLCVEIFCQYNDDIWNMREEDLTRRTGAQLIKIGIIRDQAECQDAYILRERYAYPLLYLHYETELKRLTDAVSSVRNLHMSGRNGTHAYYDIEECIINARSLSEKMVSRDGISACASS